VRRSQLLQPFNHYTGVSRFRDPVGDSVYHAFTMRVDKQMGHGLMFHCVGGGEKGSHFSGQKGATRAVA
jgi:hypothetical protein